MLEQWAWYPSAGRRGRPEADRPQAEDRREAAAGLRAPGRHRVPAPAIAVPAARPTTPTPVGPIPLTQKKIATAGEISTRKPGPTPAALTALAQAPTVQFKLDELPPASALAPVRIAPITARHATTGPAPAAQAAPPVAVAAPAAPVERATAAEFAAPAELAAPAVRAAPAEIAAPAARAATPAPRENGTCAARPRRTGAKRTPPPRCATAGAPLTRHAVAVRPRHQEQAAQDPAIDAHDPQHGLDAVEADFSARKADLYKQEDVESSTTSIAAARAVPARRSTSRLLKKAI